MGSLFLIATYYIVAICKYVYDFARKVKPLSVFIRFPVFYSAIFAGNFFQNHKRPGRLFDTTEYYSRVWNKRACTLMIFQSRCYPIRSYLSPIRLCFRSNILAKIQFKSCFCINQICQKTNSLAKCKIFKIHKCNKNYYMLYFNFLLDICYPIRLFDPIRLWVFQEFAKLYVYLNLYVYLIP